MIQQQNNGEAQPSDATEVANSNWVTVKVLITAPKIIIQDTTYNVRRDSEFICTLMEKKCLLALTLGWRYNSNLYGANV